MPRPKAIELERLYAAHYNFGGEQQTVYARLREIFLSSPFYRWWLALDGDISFHARQAPQNARRLIDIGCNEGRGLDRYRTNGFTTVEGLETNKIAAASARARGYIVHETNLADFTPELPYDVAVLSNVIEHTLDPIAMLNDVRRVLKPGGQLWLSCPNADSWARQRFKTSWINWHVPFHISHFTYQTLSIVLTKANFHILSYQQVTPSLWIAQSLIASQSAISGKPTIALRRPLKIITLISMVKIFGFLPIFLLNKRNHGDCHIVVAQTPKNGF